MTMGPPKLSIPAAMPVGFMHSRMEGRFVFECDAMEWAAFMDGNAQRHVGQDMVGKWLISTVFIGAGCNFETMVFDDQKGKGVKHEAGMARVDSWVEAKSLHRWVVSYFRRHHQNRGFDGQFPVPWMGDWV